MKYSIQQNNNNAKTEPSWVEIATSEGKWDAMDIARALRDKFVPVEFRVVNSKGKVMGD